MSSPTRSPSPSPPSPVPFIPPAPRSPTWDEYLASNSSGSGGPYEFSFPDGFGSPIAANVPEPPRETRHGLTYPPTSSGGPSPSYYATQRRPPMKMTPMNQKRKANALPPPTSFPTMATPPPVVVTFPLSVTRAGMKTAIDLKAAAVTPRDDGPNATQVGRWTKREHELFLEGLQRFGKSWKKISSLVHTRTLVQIRTHAQKYLQKQSRAAIKADAKAAEEAVALQSQQMSKPQQQHQQQQPFRQDERCLPQQQPRVAAAGGVGRQPALQVEVPRVPTPPARQWKSPPAGDRSNTFIPLAFPSTLSTSAPASRSAFQTNSVSRLDQLLQDDSSSVPVFVDEYYTSPTAIEDDLLRPLYTGEQWVPRLAHPAASANYSNKRRRLGTSGPPCTSAAASTTVAAPALRSAFPSGSAFEPLPAPDNLSSPNTSPSAYTPRQSAAAAVLLAAHETDESTNYPNAWL